MGWWAIGDDEYMGDAPASTTASALDKLAQSRTDAGKPLLTYDEIAVLLAATVSRSSRELATRKDAKFIALDTFFEGVADPLRVNAEGAKPVPEELAVLRDWAKTVTNEYKDAPADPRAKATARRRPSARELLEAAAHVLRANPTKYLIEGEARKLKGLHPVFQHTEGQVSADEVVAIIAASLRRNERRLGLMVDNGASMAPETVIAKTADGREITTSVATAQASREQVDEMCARFEAAISEHREEKPETYLAKLAPSDRERLHRNSDQRGLPTLEQLIEHMRKQLARTPERWAPLKSVQVETSERSSFGLPSRPPPAKFVDNRIRVRHAKFGEGFVERTFEDGERKFDVLFAGGKRVTLMARFLEIIDPTAPPAPKAAPAPKKAPEPEPEAEEPAAAAAASDAEASDDDDDGDDEEPSDQATTSGEPQE